MLLRVSQANCQPYSHSHHVGVRASTYESGWGRRHSVHASPPSTLCLSPRFCSMLLSSLPDLLGFNKGELCLPLSVLLA